MKANFDLIFFIWFQSSQEAKTELPVRSMLGVALKFLDFLWEDRLREPARAGDAYAQYVLSWSLRLKGDLEGAYENMKKSANMLFPPAVLDIAGFHSLCWDADKIKSEAKLHLENSDRVGHMFTFARRLQIYRSGRFGALNLMLGYLVVPCAFARVILGMTFSSHSAALCLFDRR